MKNKGPAWLVWSALWTVYIVWGSTYLAIRITVETLPPFLTTGVRFVVAGAIMYLFLLARRGPSGVAVTAREVGAASLIGGLLLLGGNGLVMIAEQDVPSGLASLIISSVPLWVVLFRAITGDRVPGGTLAGVAVGFIGVALLVLPGGSNGGTLAGMLLLVLAALLWATGSFISKKMPLPKDPFTSTTWQMLTGGAIAAVAGVIRGEAASIDAASFSAASVWALVYLIFVGSLLAFTAYTWVLQNAPISKVATYAYVNPVIAVFLGWAILSEAITAMLVVGAAIIVASVAFIIQKETPPEPHPEPTPAPQHVGEEVLEPSS
ncbi:MAG: EamA family transporter [Actinomycetota bacterium]